MEKITNTEFDKIFHSIGIPLSDHFRNFANVHQGSLTSLIEDSFALKSRTHYLSYDTHLHIRKLRNSEFNEINNWPLHCNHAPSRKIAHKSKDTSVF